MRTVLSFLFLSLFSVGCRYYYGPTGLVLSGNIAGSLYLVDSTQRFLTDRSGATISTEPNTVSATSSPDGSWQLSNIPAGIYTIRFSKSGYFTLKLHNQQFVGGGTYFLQQNFIVEQIPNVRVTHLSVTLLDSVRQIRFQGTLSSPDTVWRTVRILILKSPLTNSSTFQFLDYISCSVPAGSREFVKDAYTSWSTSDIGATRYSMALVGPEYAIPGTLDPATKMYEFDTPGVTFSNVVSFVSP